jgi:hypothetical protein
MSRTIAAALLADALAAILIALMAQPAPASHGPVLPARSTFTTTIGVELAVANGRLVGGPKVTVTQFELPAGRRVGGI